MLWVLHSLFILLFELVYVYVAYFEVRSPASNRYTDPVGHHLRICFVNIFFGGILGVINKPSVKRPLADREQPGPGIEPCLCHAKYLLFSLDRSDGSLNLDESYDAIAAL